jgi:hypothetical protein
MPADEFSTGSTAASTAPIESESNVKRKVANPTDCASGKTAETASSEYAPGSPW